MNTAKLTLITPPALAVSLPEAKAWLRIQDPAEDSAILGLIRGATNRLDARGFLGRCLEPQTWELALDEFPDREIVLPLGPVTAVVSVQYDDVDGFEQTVDPANYRAAMSDFGGRVVPRPAFAWPATADAPESVRVRFAAGTGTPEGVRQAIFNMVALGFEPRGNVASERIGDWSTTYHSGSGRMLTPDIVADLAPFRRPAVI